MYSVSFRRSWYLQSLAENPVSKTRQTEITRGALTTVLLKLTNEQIQLLPPKFETANLLTQVREEQQPFFLPIPGCVCHGALH